MSDAARRRLRVNPTLCTGFGYCAEIVPELVALDDWGFPIVNSRPIQDDAVLGLVRRAVATCPRLALLIEEAAPQEPLQLPHASTRRGSAALGR